MAPRLRRTGVYCAVCGWYLHEQDGFGRESGDRREVQLHVRVSCKNVIKIISLDQESPTRECLVKKGSTWVRNSAAFTPFSS